MSAPRCDECRFYDRRARVVVGGVEVDDGNGYCRIRAPQPVTWPIVRADDWCGEFVPANPPPPPPIPGGRTREQKRG